jgi:hypothetical protein
MFLSSQILVLKLSLPLKPMDYIYEVLVPEVAIRLIRDDYGGNITLENAREIMTNSREFGSYMHSDD